MSVVGSTSYATAEAVLNLTRSIINDAAVDLSGDIFSDDQPYTFPLLNSSYQAIQDELAVNGVRTLERETILLNITPAAVIDPGTQVFIYDQGYNDGATNHTSPVLPPDMIVPLRLWERWSGTTNRFVEMQACNDGLPSEPQTSYLRYWEFRDDGLYMIGATQAIDMRLRYAAYLPQLTDASSTVLIRRATNALAYLTAAQFSAARGSPLADTFRQQGMEFVEQIVEYTIREKQRQNHRRVPYSRGRWRSGR